jgi:hypothetical protein
MAESVNNYEQRRREMATTLLIEEGVIEVITMLRVMG